MQGAFYNLFYPLTQSFAAESGVRFKIKELKNYAGTQGSGQNSHFEFPF